jgi:hypothetical protein
MYNVPFGIVDCQLSVFEVGLTPEDYGFKRFEMGNV